MYNTSSEGVIPIRSVREKYFFKKKLGKGGFCDVFLAENRESHMQVAIKMMEMKTASERIDRRVARFRREMMLYSQLNHPHIVKVLDSGETETGLLFIVFEYIQGKNLAQLLKKEGALSLDRTLNLMKQILSGLRTAHDKGIIHRDLKPENVMITQINGTEQAKILDFGISTFIAGQFGDMNRITATKEFLGTPAYAAPEQLRGEPVSQKVDIYAWGLLFLECITGKPPFSNPSVASIVQQQLTPSPIPLPAALSDHRLGTLLRWTLEKDADRRAGNCSVISSHLDNVSLDGISLNNGFIKGEPASNEAAGAVDFVVYETYVSSQERRQVTVVCFSLSMYEKEDFQFPDVLDEIYQDLVAHGLDLFKRFGAHVVSEGGDSILAFFGYPDASDTDARRAVRSALELATSIARRSMVFSNQHGIRFSYRIGIHTGMITVRKTGEGKPQLSGLTINCAARLCNAANADSIFISEGSYHLLKNIVECNEVPVETLPQFISNLHIFRIIGERHIECFGGIDRFAVSPMVGRDGELAQLFDIWKSIGKNNIGRAIMIQGEAGIGKSRLSAEFALMALRENGGWMECRCLPEGKNSALHPIIGFLYSYFGLSRASSPKNNATALEKQLTSFGIDCSIAMPLFCSWFGLQSDVYAIPTLSPQRQKEYMLDITAEILVKKALMSSSVIIFEDLHWADPTTIELLPKLIAQVKKRGVLLLMSARPVFAPLWNKHDVEMLSVNRLGDAEVETIVRNIMDSEAVGKDTVARIIARVDGVPLFAEEVTRLIREKGPIKNEIPDTLRDLLMGRIDRLGSAKETVQLASVIGRIFDYDLIEKVSLKDAASLLADLDQLISAGLVYVGLQVGNPRYMFHHALVRDAAYDSLAKKTREEMHFRIATTLEREFAEVASAQPETLAYHWAGAKEFKKGSQYSFQAAIAAISRSQYYEAIGYAEESLDCIEKSDCDGSMQELKMRVLLLLFNAYTATIGPNSKKVNQIVANIENLLKVFNRESESVFAAIPILITYFQILPDDRKFSEYLDQGLCAGHKSNRYEYLSFYYLSKGHFAFKQGDLESAQESYTLSYKYYDMTDRSVLNIQLPGDIKVFSLSIHALLHTIRGEIKKSIDTIDTAIGLAEKVNNNYSKGIALGYKLGIYHYLNNKNMLKQMIDECTHFLAANDLTIPLVMAYIFKGWADNDLTLIEKYFPIGLEMGFNQLKTYWNFIYAQVECANNKYKEALRRIEYCIEYAGAHNEKVYLPELYRLKGCCLKMESGESAQEVTFAYEKAIESAMQLGENLFLYRSRIDLYKLKGDTSDVMSDIRQMYERFAAEPLCVENEDALRILGKA